MTTIHTTRPDAIEHIPADRREAVTVSQYSRRGIFAIWAAAALPMAALAWIVAPALADGNDIESLVRPLLLCITAGMIWQFVLVVALVGYEQRSLRWSRLREALALRRPQSPRTGRIGGKVWLIAIPLVVATGLRELISLPAPLNRNLGEFLSSDAGETMLSGAWGWFAVIVVMGLFNTVLGEELLFRGVLLPRMRGAFGERDWVANGVIFAAYHLHMPWAIPGILLDTVLMSYPAKRYRSTWMSIVVHSAQNLVVIPMVLILVLS